MKRRATVIGITIGIALVLVSLISFTNSRIYLAKEKKVMAGFETLMDKEDVTAAELIQYTNENISAVSKGNAVTLVKGIEEVQKANLSQWEKKFDNDALQKELALVYQENGWSLSGFEGIRDNKLKAIVDQAISNGYKVETAEGFFFPVIDYAFYNEYHEAVTMDLAEYFEIMAVESDQTPVKDAALMIDWEEILSRAARQEQFIKEYSSSTQVEPMRELLNRYVTFALFGANNTPLFSYDTKQMMPEAKQAYQEYAWDEEDGSFSALMREYLSVLEENDYRLTSEVDAYRKKAVKSRQ